MPIQRPFFDVLVHPPNVIFGVFLSGTVLNVYSLCFQSVDYY